MNSIVSGDIIFASPTGVWILGAGIPDLRPATDKGDDKPKPYFWLGAEAEGA